MSFDFRRRRWFVLAGSIAVLACSALFALQAQVVPSGGGESRLPKGIRGLAQGQAKSPSANWLLDAQDDQERFRRIQILAGGTDRQMWQIGYRYEQVYRAIDAVSERHADLP